MTLKEHIKKIISDNYFSHWGNSMGTMQKNSFEEACMDLIERTSLDPLGVVLLAIAKKLDELP